MNTKSSHGVFYNPGLGWARTGPVPFGTLDIGHGVFIGQDAIILPPTRSIGDGAVVAAGAVVYRDIPPYAVVAGNPAQVVGFRHSKPVIAEIVASRWWEKPPSQLVDTPLWARVRPQGPESFEPCSGTEVIVERPLA